MSVPEPVLLNLQIPVSAPCEHFRDTGSTAPAISRADREQLLLQHMPSVRFIARKLHRSLPPQVELDDLVSAGTIGLMEACQRFDPRRHVQFKSYAQFRIRGAILDWLRTLDWGPRELRRKARDIADASRTLAQQLGRTPSEQEIAAALGVDLAEFHQITGELKSLEVGSLNAEHSRDEDDEELEFVAAPADQDPLSQFLAVESRQRLADALENLPEKERLVLTLYYFEELTMREIGLTLGVVESRVSQIHSSALRRLRSAVISRRASAQPEPSSPRRSQPRRPARKPAA